MVLVTEDTFNQVPEGTIYFRKIGLVSLPSPETVVLTLYEPLFEYDTENVSSSKVAQSQVQASNMTEKKRPSHAVASGSNELNSSFLHSGIAE